MEGKIRLAVFGQKRLSREGGIEIVVKELCTRMAQNGCEVTCYNRAGHHVSGAEYDKTIEYDGIRQKVVPTIEKKGLAAVSSSFFAALYVITDNLVKQKRYGSAVTVIPTTEVVFVSKDGIESNAALNRDELWRTQTPHSYRFDELWEVHNKAIVDGVTNMAASCSLMQKYGYTTYFSKGSEKNIKITTIEDIEIFKALLNAKNDDWIKK